MKKETTLGTWLLRIFLGSFLIAVAAPIAVAWAVLSLSADTKILRNAATSGPGEDWRKTVELNIGAAPLGLARLVLPFVDVPNEARQAFSAVRSVEVSVQELRSSEPDLARILSEADTRMRKRGWDRVVGVVDGDTAVAVYCLPGKANSADLRISTLVLSGRQMVAVSGRGNLQPLFELAMDQANSGFLAKHRLHGLGPIFADIRRN